MPKPTKRDLWIRGWTRWVNWGGAQECAPGAERAGFEAAAYENDQGGGERPTVALGREECPYGGGVIVVDDNGRVEGRPYVLPHAPGETAWGLPAGRYRIGADGEVEVLG